MVCVAQLARALGCGPEGRQFESAHSPQISPFSSVEEQGISNPWVGSSNLSKGAIISPFGVTEITQSYGLCNWGSNPQGETISRYSLAGKALALGARDREFESLYFDHNLIF